MSWALLAYLAFSVPHFLFHLSHLEGASSLEAAVLVGTLAGSVALPVGLLVTQLALGRDQADGRPVKSSID